MRTFDTIGAHWYNRKMNLKSCADIVLQFLLRLKESNTELFGKWYKKANSKKGAMENEINLSYQAIKDLLRPNGEDGDYPEPTFNLSLWNGAPTNGEIATVSFSLGGEQQNKFTNHCVIEMPYKGIQFEKYQKQENQKIIIEIIKKFWQPEWIQVDDERIEY